MRTVLVAGVGLIGTSVALALRSQGIEVYLSDPDPKTLRTAVSLGAGRTDPPSEQVDLAVLAVPPEQVAGLLAQLQKQETAIAYSDVASVKLQLQNAVLLLGCDLSSYVGGHPLAGRERSGPLAARADLFRGRPWVLTPTNDTQPVVLDQVLELVALCGAIPTVADAAVHDRAVALISHMPHMMSSLVASRLAEADPFSLRLAGTGARDMTRIAAGDVDLWTEILTANAAAIAEVMEQVNIELSIAIKAMRALAGGGQNKRAYGLRELRRLLQRGVRGQAQISRQTAAHY